jgi:hypothetical protein
LKNNKGVQFVMTTVIGGLLFLVPVGFLGFVLCKTFGVMLLIAEPTVTVDSSQGGMATASVTVN